MLQLNCAQKTCVYVASGGGGGGETWMLIFDVEKCKSIYDNFTEKTFASTRSMIKLWQFYCDYNFTVIVIMMMYYDMALQR